eukprot:c19485_g1_i3 orf=2-172(-)
MGKLPQVHVVPSAEMCSSLVIIAGLKFLPSLMIFMHGPLSMKYIILAIHRALRLSLL